MKMHEPEAEEKFDIEFRPRETEKVSIKIPKDALKALKQVAENRDMSAHALLKFYIGQGLRQDIAQHGYVAGEGTSLSK